MIIHDITSIIVKKNENMNCNIEKTKVTLANSLLNHFICNKNITIKYKFKFIKQVLENIFVEKDVKKFFLECMQKIQKIYWALQKFAFLYKFKKSEIVVKEDLYLNTIDVKAKNVICIFQDNSRYLFILSDLVNIINMSLSNCPHFFSEPLSCKNPYNNNPFNKSTLYNIYFSIVKYNLSIPELFHLFFLTNFNLTLFKENNEYFIREYAIKDYIKSKDVTILYEDIMIMLNNIFIGFGKKFNIDPNFPIKKLVDIMRPYLLLHFMSRYSLNTEKQLKSYSLLKKKLLRFYNFNPIFGRKKIDLISIYCSVLKKMVVKKVIYFMDKAISFNEKEPEFMSSHFKLADNNTFVPNNQEQPVLIENEDSDNTSSSSENESNNEEISIAYISDDSSSDIDNNDNNLIMYHVDVNSEYFNAIFNQSFINPSETEDETEREDEIEETKEDGSIS
jgi:hypothetical protein